MPFKRDVYALIGGGAALLVVLLFYFLLIAPKDSEGSTTASLIALAVAISPLFVAYRVEQTVGTKIFTDVSDFSVAVAWFPLTILASQMTDNQTIIVIVMAYARGLCGICGTILALTFVAKLMDVGDPKNKKTLVQEILSVVIWGYIGKKFFDFIGVTKPINFGSPVPGTRWP